MEKTIVIPVHGDSGTDYKVEFVISNGICNVFCDCPAAINGSVICKHRTRLLSGNFTNVIAKEKELENLKQEIGAISAEITNQLRPYIDVIEHLEEEISVRKEKLKRAKKDYARALNNGIKV